MMRTCTLISLLLWAASAHAAAVPVEASGSVHNPGKHQLPSGSRLSRLALTAAPTADAYLLGAALLREPQRLEQTRLKAGLMFDLEQLESTATSKSAVAVSIQQLLRWIDSLPVTGRVAHPLESRVLEATRAYDLPVQAGDHLFYPARPTTITISGAVSQQCTLAHIALQAPIVYLQHCKKTVGASADYIHVIQPDGHTERLGIALWNRGPASSLAPGAVIFVPLAETVVRKTAPSFNEDAVRFLATQLLAAPGTNL